LREMKVYRNVKEIILVSLSCIGDVLLTTPVMENLKLNFPGSSLTVVAGPTAMPILDRHSSVDRTIVYDNKNRHRGFAGITRLVKELRTSKYDMAVDLRNTAIPYFLRSRYKITSYRAHIKNNDANGRHAIDRHLDVLEMAEINVMTRRISVTLPPDVVDHVESFIEGTGLGGMKLAAVYPEAGSLYKRYPSELFEEALRMLDSDSDTHFLAVGAEDDRETCENLASAMDGRMTSIAGRLDILELGALLQKCGVMISNDSGPMHLSAAVGTPTVALFGPTDANRYGPRGDSHRILWHREECNPCKYPVCGRESCINKIPPASVARAASEICYFLEYRG